jgi:ribosomal protein L17
MRHRYNKLKYLETGVVKTSLVIRNLLTSLIKNWEITTTSKRAKILKSVADKFFNRAKKYLKNIMMLNCKKNC